jgi:bacteriocin-like protein
MKTLVIKDLAFTQVSVREESGTVRPLSDEEMQQVQGGRAIAVLVDGRPGGVVDDFELEMAIFKGDIGVTYK